MRRVILLSTALVLTAAATVPQAQNRHVDTQRRRNQIQLLEGVLARAVGLGAAEVASQMQRLDPTMAVLTGRARARGFVLEGYGVFFDVEIPALRQSVVWSMMTVQRDMQIARSLDNMKRAVDNVPSQEPAGQRLQQELKNLQRLVGPVQARSNAGGQMAEVSAASTPGGPTAVSDTRPALPPALLDDPNAHYTDAVKRQLIDAMLDHSLPMDLGPDEWLTVAARDGEGPTTPGEIYDPETIVLRVKGSDLAIYAADRSRRDEIRGKVHVTVF
ncbi:MAG TPA: hypothetical protein VD833_08975 [Vicinamibacterales bacterium]|nr:hypothetical protein [Vicinamibacterales bacterium]